MKQFCFLILTILLHVCVHFGVVMNWSKLWFPYFPSTIQRKIQIMWNNSTNNWYLPHLFSLTCGWHLIIMHLIFLRLRSRALHLKGYIRIFGNCQYHHYLITYFCHHWVRDRSFHVPASLMKNKTSHNVFPKRTLGIARHASPTRRAPLTTDSPSTSGVPVRRACPLSLRNLCSSWRSGGSNWYQPRERGRERPDTAPREVSLSDHGSAESRDHLCPGGCDRRGSR